MNVAKWGNSLAIRLPAAVVKALDLVEGDDVAVRVVGARDMEIERKPDRAALLARLRAFEGRLPADFIFARDEAERDGAERDGAERDGAGQAESGREEAGRG